MKNSQYQSIGIVVGPHDNQSVVSKLRDLLLKKGFKIVHEPHDLPNKDDSTEQEYYASSEEDFADHSDLICCIGGDGTMLNAISRYYQHNKPFSGINLGHVGFLVDLPPNEIEMHFLDLLSGKSCSERRMMLEVELVRHNEVIAHYACANEVFFRNVRGLSMIFLDVLVNDHPVHTESGDGLLISTPTGSTAYNLSNGGPILEPCIPAICLTPICPNYLNSRPVVIGEHSKIEIRVPVGRKLQVVVGCDGQQESIMEEGDIARVRKHEMEWTLLHPQNYEYFSLLRSKLNWGMGTTGLGWKNKT